MNNAQAVTVSHKKVSAGAAGAAGGHVIFPAGKRPEESPIFTHNELFIAAPAGRIWAPLIRAARWPDFYAGAKDVQIEGGSEDLALGTTFRWKTLGVRVTTVIEEFVPGLRLGWSGRVMGSTAYHGWVITPTPEGCHVVTEETQQGFVPSVGRFFLRKDLLKLHQQWLEGLARVATTEAPPAGAR
jgi:hypothetical protein